MNAALSETNTASWRAFCIVAFLDPGLRVAAPG